MLSRATATVGYHHWPCPGVESASAVSGMSIVTVGNYARVFLSVATVLQAEAELCILASRLLGQDARYPP